MVAESRKVWQLLKVSSLLTDNIGNPSWAATENPDFPEMGWNWKFQGETQQGFEMVLIITGGILSQLLALKNRMRGWALDQRKGAVAFWECITDTPGYPLAFSKSEQRRRKKTRNESFFLQNFR